MSDSQLWAVVHKHYGDIKAVFSNEGQAWLYRAKLQLIDTSFAKEQYDVKPLPVDTGIPLEPRYYAVYTMEAGEPWLTENEISVGCDALVASLPEGGVDISEEDTYITFSSHGWSEAEAKNSLIDAAKTYLEGWYAEHDPEGLR